MVIDGLSIKRFVFVIFLLLSFIDKGLSSSFDMVVMLPDDELYDSTKKLLLSSFNRLLMFDDLKDLPDDAKCIASNIDVLPAPFLPKKKLTPGERLIDASEKHLKLKILRFDVATY